MRAALARQPLLAGTASTVGAIAVLATIGATAALSPRVAVAAAAAVVLGALVSLGPRLPAVFVGALGTILVGYVFLGKGFAYLGKPPVYVGEVALGLGLLALLVGARRGRIALTHWLLLAFMLLGAARTLPYLRTDGLNALRDATLWGYGTFAIAVSLTLSRKHLERAVGAYGRLLPLFVAWVPVALLATRGLAGSIPTVPGSATPLIVFKSGDMGVHLAGAAAFILLGVAGPARRRLDEKILWLLWFAAFVAASAGGRGAMLAAMFGVATAFVLRPTTRRRIQFVAVGVGALTILAVVNPQVAVREDGRTASIGQLGLNLVTITDSSGPANLEGTKNFRLAWWNKIWGYTVHGRYFWSGKGFGINLADDDGFQPKADHSLRAPHNTHVTVLARMGVPGLALWIALQLSFMATMIRALRRNRARRGDPTWSRLYGFLLVYWLAMMVNTSFDPYLEGPQGSIWFWTVVGVGLAAVRLEPRARTREASA